MAQHQKEFKLEKDFIELDNLLKVTNFAASGAEAKQMIRAGLVKVNGTVENKVRRKLCPKDVVDFAENKILIGTHPSVPFKTGADVQRLSADASVADHPGKKPRAFPPKADPPTEEARGVSI